MENQHRSTDFKMRQAPAPVDWSAVRKVHVMGVCGSAMGAMARMLRKRGFEVRGSDRGAYPPMSTILAQEGVHIYEGYRASNLDWEPDVVVVGNVIRPTYEEAVALRERQIPHCSLPQVLADQFIGARQSVVITGTHGKTSTSSMTAWLLHVAERDPGFMIGGITGNFDSNHRVGGDQVFVSEGDEYDTAYFDKGPKFLHYRPQIAAINNLEFDHADIYDDVDAVEAAFCRFVRLLPPDGRLVVPAHEIRACRVASLSRAPVWTTAIDGSADIVATDVTTDDQGTSFTLALPAASPLRVVLPLWGEHNLLNALVAAGLAYACGVTPQVISRGLATFKLPAKRQQLRGVAGGVPVIDDFAHHPTAIRETLKSMRLRYPGRRLLALFEVESNTSRRRVFQDGFAASLGLAERVYFCSPLAKDDSLSPEETLSLPELMATLTQGGVSVVLDADIPGLARRVVAESRPGQDVIVVMSGRDFHGIHDLLLEGLKDRLEAPE